MSGNQGKFFIGRDLILRGRLELRIELWLEDHCVLKM